MRKEGVTAIFSMGLAFLASQHHTLHMLLMTVGVGGAGMSFMSIYPTVRRGMILMSLVMTLLMLVRLRRRQVSAPMRVMNGLSAAVSLGLIGWSVFQFGL